MFHKETNIYSTCYKRWNNTNAPNGSNFAGDSKSIKGRQKYYKSLQWRSRHRKQARKRFISKQSKIMPRRVWFSEQKPWPALAQKRHML